jgi:murein DD-endopeptidase MepM/ murein hydrolase activator NlpD
MRSPLIVALLLVLACTPMARASKVYKTVDADGITHYSDQPPAEGVAAEIIAVRAESQQIAELRLERIGQEHRAVVVNRIAGPIQIELGYTRVDNVVAAPALPLRQVIEAESNHVVATLRSADSTRSGGFELAFSAVPGDPLAKPDDTIYRMPLDGSAWRIDQGFGGTFSHNEPQSRYAIDIAADEGTPVVAARDGVVMQVEDEFEGAGLDREKFGTRANHVRVLHADGTMAVYAHLMADSVVARVGSRVRSGQRIGASGNTGFSTGPHLHFALQVNRGMELVSIPFALQGLDGSIAIPGE